jgi:hypothetical protein
LRALILGATALVAACHTQEDRINDAIAVVIDHGDGAVLKMDVIAPFAWDRLYVFEAYTPPDEINRTVGGNIATPWDAAAQSDGYDMLIFVQAGHPVAKVNHLQFHGDFRQLVRAEGWSREAAVFRVEDDDGGLVQGRPWRYLKPLE